MSQNFTKLFAGITDSTVWAEPDRTRIVWITMLAMADQFGRVFASVPGLAHRARVPKDDTSVALKAFLSPDPDSRTKDYEGRRIETIDGGWRLLNHGKYREMRSEVDRQEQNRLAQARWRVKQRSSAGISNSKQSKPRSAQAEAEAEAKEPSPPSGAPVAARASKRCPPDFVVTADLQQWARSDVPLVDTGRETEIFRDHTWRTGISDWQAAWKNWMRKEQKRLAEKKAPQAVESTYRREKRERAEELTAGLASAKPPGYKPAPIVIEGETHVAIAEH